MLPLPIVYICIVCYTPCQAPQLNEAWEVESTMSKSTRNSGQRWTPSADASLKTMAHGNTPTRVIGLKLGRTAAAVYKRASELGVPLKPTNQSPYG